MSDKKSNFSNYSKFYKTLMQFDSLSIFFFFIIVPTFFEEGENEIPVFLKESEFYIWSNGEIYFFI